MDLLSLCVFLILLEHGRGRLIQPLEAGQERGLTVKLETGQERGLTVKLETELCYPETSPSLNCRTLPDTGSWKFCLKTMVGTGFTGTRYKRIRGNPFGDCANKCTSLPGCMTFAIDQYGRCFTTRWCPHQFDLNYSVYEIYNVTERCYPAEYLPAPKLLQFAN